MLNPDNRTLEWCAKWIEDSLRAETNQRTIEFGKNMAMTIRAVKTKEVSTSDSARRAAEAQNRDKAQEIILATEAALEEKFDSIARHELVNRITAALNAAAPADNDAESLLSKVTTIADIGSAEEFGDALERLKSIRQLIAATTKEDR